MPEFRSPTSKLFTAHIESFYTVTEAQSTGVENQNTDVGVRKTIVGVRSTDAEVLSTNVGVLNHCCQGTYTHPEKKPQRQILNDF